MKQNVWTKYMRYVYASDYARDKSIEARRQDDLHRTIHFFIFVADRGVSSYKATSIPIYKCIRIIGIFFFFLENKRKKDKERNRRLLHRISLSNRKDYFSNRNMCPGCIRCIRYRLFLLKETNRMAKRNIYIQKYRS